MKSVNITIDGQALQVPAGTTILEAARSADIYIPSLCYHPDLPPAKNGQAVSAVFQGEFKLEAAGKFSPHHDPASACLSHVCPAGRMSPKPVFDQCTGE